MSLMWRFPFALPQQPLSFFMCSLYRIYLFYLEGFFFSFSFLLSLSSSRMKSSLDQLSSVFLSYLPKLFEWITNRGPMNTWWIYQSSNLNQGTFCIYTRAGHLGEKLKINLNYRLAVSSFSFIRLKSCVNLFWTFFVIFQISSQNKS